MILDDYLNLVPSFNRDKQDFVTWLSGILAPIIDTQNIDWESEYDLDVAIGVSLDYIGEWIGQSRSLKIPRTFNGNILYLNNDEEYRQVLKIKSALNKWDGTAETIYNAVKSVYGYNFVGIEDLQDMSHNVIMDVQNFIENQAMLMASIYQKAKPVGVKINQFSFANKGYEYYGIANNSIITITVYPKE